MTEAGRRNYKKILLTIITIGAIVSSGLLWVRGLLQSPYYEPGLQVEEKYIREYIETNSPDNRQEKILAEGYWLRYRDISKNNYWGVDGPMGIWGPRDHFTQHGRREGRIFAPVIQPRDLKKEQKLAESYWQRYPNVRESGVWGKKSSMGILGPRDHFQHRGRFQGKVWGVVDAKTP